MREILFRGRRKDNGEWIESGTLGRCGDDGIVWDYFLGTGKRAVHEIDSHGNICASATLDECLFCMVDDETVGQFTGMTDKNGKKIFEGDILQYSIEEDQAVFVGDVKFGEFNPDGGALLDTNVGFYVELVDLEGKRTYMRKDIGFWVKFRQVKVIGNIHDNPELLGGASNE